MNLGLTLALLAACSHPNAPRPVEPRRGPDADPFPLLPDMHTTGTVTLHARGRSYDPAPILPPAPPDPLRLACPVCGAAVGVRCDPERLGKAGKRGAVAHRERR